jgi:mannosyl-oligosaccharide alpha-1,2-mannosidase
LLVDGEQPQYSRLCKYLNSDILAAVLFFYNGISCPLFAHKDKKSIEGMKKYMIRQTDKANLLFIHAFDTRNKIISGTMDHLSCFVPGMLAIGSRIFEDPEDLVVAEGLLETCVHMYLTSNTGLSP